MDARVFTTEKIARILEAPEWRIVRFAQFKKYGITPALVQASGPGSRRLYNVENVCEMALALWLTQAGLRIDVIGRVLQQVRGQGGLSRFLDEASERESLRTYLAIVRKLKGKFRTITGQKTTQEAVYIQDWERLGNILTQEHFSSALVIDVGFRLQFLRRVSAWDD
jgi:DNA-binding transcriptional MerR regulator